MTLPCLCLLHIRVFFGGKTKSPWFDLFIHWLIKQKTNTYRNHFFKVIRKSLYCNVIIGSVRFKDEDDYEYKIHSSFFAYSQKTEIPESSIVLFFTQKGSRSSKLVKEGKPSPDHKKHDKLLTFSFLFPPVRH